MEMYGVLMTDKLVWNASSSLTWRDPLVNANLQSNTSSMTVAQLALDMHVDMMVAGSAAAESVVAGSASNLESGGAVHCLGCS